MVPDRAIRTMADQ